MLFYKTCLQDRVNSSDILEEMVISKFIFDKVENIHLYVFIVSSEVECWEHKGRCTLF